MYTLNKMNIQVGTLALLCAFLITPAIADERTNIIYLMADDLGYADFSPEFMPRSYQIMQNFGTQVPFYSMQNCAPTRTAFMTGKLPSSLGITGVDSPPAYNGIDQTEIMLSELLQNSGYSTGLFGKWHLGLSAEQSPLKNGFDEFLGFTHGWINYYGPKSDGSVYPDGSIGHDHHTAHDFQFGGIPLHTQSYSTFAFRNAAVEFIERNAEQEKPFFAYIPFNAPHTPHAAPRQYVDLYKNYFGVTDAQISFLFEYEDTVLAIPKSHNLNLSLEAKLGELLYYASVRAMDDAIADIFEAVVDSGELDNTLFLFASDNGAGVGNILRHGNNGILRGGKGSAYEGSNRVANFLVWKGKVPVNHHVGINIWVGDLYATFANIANVAIPDTTIESNDVTVPLLSGSSNFIRKHGGRHIVSHTSKTIVGDRIRATWAINNFDKKYIRVVELDNSSTQILSINEELFDLRIDPGETTNQILNPSYTSLLERMRRKFNRYGGDIMLLNLPTTRRTGWRGYTIPNEWGFPGRQFQDHEILKSKLF